MKDEIIIKGFHPCHRGLYVRFEHEDETVIEEIQGWGMMEIVVLESIEGKVRATKLFPMILDAGGLCCIIEISAEYEIITERDLMQGAGDDDNNIKSKTNTL